METNFDVLIIGAGLSGISMACQLKTQCPGQRVALLERRKAIGGTWDLFRYPGVRSDSDMFTFGYAFRPWNELKVLADGESIRSYVEDTAREYGIHKDIHFGIKTTQASWSSDHKRWTISAIDESSGEPCTFTCNFLVNCTGYYNHDQGHLPSFPGVERFKGQCIHPQHWPKELDYHGKRVVVIGSGATAVTLLPSMAQDTAHITMLQRSPSYVFSLPSHDKISEVLQRFLPDRWVYGLARRRNLLLARMIYKLSRRWPKQVRALLLAGVKKHVGEGFDMSHFSPHYKPWDERLCAVPDADLFKVLREGKASIVTDHIDTFTETGIRLKSGKELQADIVVAATGLQLQSLGGMALRVDGQPANDQRADDLQGRAAAGRAQHGLAVRLHQCIVDAEGRHGGGLRLPPAQPHAAQRGRRRHRACARRADAGRTPSWGRCARATCSAARRCCRGKARACRGAWFTTSSRTARCCSRTRWTTRRWSSAARQSVAPS